MFFLEINLVLSIYVYNIAVLILNDMTKKELDELTYKVIGCAIEVQKIMGTGLLESVYQQCMIEELKHRKIIFCTELQIPVIYKSKLLNIDFRCDLFIETQKF
jgi:hypothetical protein